MAPHKPIEQSVIVVFLNVRLVRTGAGYSAQEKYIHFWLNLAQSFKHMVICAPTRVAERGAQFDLDLDADKVTICELPNYRSSMELYAKYPAIRRRSIMQAEKYLDDGDYFVAVVPNLLGLSLSKVAARKNLPCAFYVRGDLPQTVRFEYQKSWKKILAVPLSDLLHAMTKRRARTTLTFVVGEALAKQYQRAGIPVQPIITSLIRERDIRPARNSGDQQQREMQLLSIGRLSAERGIDVLVRATAHLQQSMGNKVALRIIGDGPEMSSLKDLVRELDVDDVSFDGYVMDKVTLQNAMDDASLMAISSHTEGLPKTVLEALACGCPLVSTAVGGIPELVEESEAALLVPPGNAELLAQAFAEVLTNPELAAKLSNNGHALIRQQTFEVQRKVFLDALLDNAPRKTS